jgi:hypothetical protein
MDDPSSDPETAAEAGQRLDDLLNKSMTGEEGSAIQAINLKLSRMSTQDTSAMTEMQFKAFDAEQDSLIKRRQGLEDTIALRDAKTEKERLAIQANIAFREGRVEDGFRLTAQAEDYGTQVTNTTIINRIKSRASRLQGNEDYMSSTGKYAGDGFAEDRTKIQIVQANEEELMGVSFDKVQTFATQIRQAALAEFKAQHPGMYKDLNITTNEDGTVDPTSFVNAITSARGNVSEKYNEILSSVIQRYKTIGAKHNVSENTIDSAAMLLTGKGLPAVTGDGATGTGTGQTDAAFSLDPTVPGPELDFDMPTDEVMEAELAKMSKEQVAELENDFPNTQAGAKDAVKSIINSGDTLTGASKITNQLHDDEFGNLVTEEINKIEDAADKAIAGNTSKTPGTMLGVGADTVVINPARKPKVVTALATELEISSEAAEKLVEDAVTRVNKPLGKMTSEDASAENVMAVLDQEDLIALGGGVAPMRYRKAILAVADAFNMNPADAEGALDNALNRQRQQREADAPETPEEKMERLNPDVVLSEDPIERLFKGRPSFGADDVPYRKVGDEFFRINDDGTLDEKPASPAIARELQKRMSSQAARSDEGSDSLLFDRDQMKRGLMYPLEMFGARVDDDAPGVPVSLFGSKSEEGEQDNRKARDLVVPSERTSPENRMRGASNAALIAAYISEDMSDLERKEIRRRLETDKSFVDQLATVIDRVNKKKKGQDSKLTEDQLKALRTRASKQQVPMARGGLMGR